MLKNLEDIRKQYKFCNLCGGSLTPKDIRILTCNKCRHETYIIPVPCNALIIENENSEIMLVRRKTDPKKGFWDLPGGFIEPGETIEESIVREINEELGIKIEKISYISSEFDTYKYKGFTFPTLGVIFLGKIKNQKPKAEDDITEFKFFAKNRLPYGKIAFTSLKRTLKKFTKNHR